MKKCEYCAKEISYFEQYCNDECHINANKYYEMSEKYGKLFSVINGIFVASFSNSIGTIVSVGSCIILGIMLIILPFPTENMISKFKIQKSMKITRIIGLALIGLGMLIALFMIFFFK